MTASFALLRVRTGPDAQAQTPLEWAGFDAAGQLLARGASFIAELPAATSLELLLPAQCVAAHQLEIPALSGKHEAALIRQALEDRILGKLEQSLIVSGERHGKQLSVWVLERQWLEQIYASFSAAGRLPDRALPEQALLLPASCAETPAGWIFQRAPGEYGLLPSEALLHAVAGDTLQTIDDLLNQPAHQSVNLLGALPGLSRASASLSFAVFKPILILLVSAALLYLLAQGLVWRQLAAQESHLRQSIRQNFAAANPGVPIIDPILQWRQRQSKPGQQGGDALDQLGQLASLVGEPLQPERIEAEEGRIKLTLTSSDAARLKQSLQGKSMRFDSQTTDKGLEQISLDLGGSLP